MKNRLSSFLKAVSGSESCVVCVAAATVIAAVVVWKVISILHGHIIEYSNLQDFTAWRR